MAKKDLLTNYSKVASIQQAFYCPSTTTPGSTVDNLITSTYCFLSRVDPWTNENNPDLPIESSKYLKQVQKSIFFVKRIESGDISPVIRRIDWTANTIYDYYRDDIDLFTKDSLGFPIYSFYVKNTFDQVFKCLWNNNGVASTVEPYFEPGIYNGSKIYEGVDGYKWKYMYTIDAGRKIKFVDDDWIPVVLPSSAPNSIANSIGVGSIDTINILTGGTGYNPSVSAITINIDGDGTGVTANAVVANGVITDITVNNIGSNYTYANVSITSGSGNGATAIAYPSPVGGHGFDPVSELGCSHIMYTCEINKDENTNIPTDITYRQAGLVINPTSNDRLISGIAYPANTSEFKTTTDLVVSGGAGTFVSDEIVYQGTSLANATFSATVLSFDAGLNLLKLINTKGNITSSGPIFGNTSGTTRTVVTINYPTFVTTSGYIAYIENITGVQRSADGIEQFKFVVSY